MNLGGPSESTCNKDQAGYTVGSGILKPLSLAHFSLATNKDDGVSHFLSSNIVHGIPCALGNDGNALKPSIEYDPCLKRCVGLSIDVDAEFVKTRTNITPEFLSKHIVTKTIVSTVTTLDNEVSMPYAVDYVPQAGEATSNYILSMIKTLQMQVLSRMQFTLRAYI